MAATREALLDFHTTYYSADIMKLAVVGRESLDELQVGRERGKDGGRCLDGRREGGSEVYGV
eukprot:evm.model.NODE_30689_length_3272_cov_9.868277.1